MPTDPHGIIPLYIIPQKTGIYTGFLLLAISAVHGTGGERAPLPPYQSTPSLQNTGQIKGGFTRTMPFPCRFKDRFTHTMPFPCRDPAILRGCCRNLCAVNYTGTHVLAPK
jgi:hypothetical protein